MFPRPSPAKIFGFLVWEPDWNARFETAVGPANRIPRACPIRIAGLFMKRIMDLFLSAFALLLLWPLLLVIALIVKLESPGPAIYPSLRAGKNGQTFVCYKFRTKVNGADGLKNSLRYFNERQDPFFKIADDPRVTRLGHFLRNYSLDELPQFWNVLKGDMNLVGPRPHPVDDYVRYRSNDHRRLDVKPGITGPWQVTGACCSISRF
jgi:lipopolysaccharide/colanic/teichoic acid biosynthesis glycosyltransferase